MQVLTTTQPAGEQVTLGGAAQYALVAVGGASLSGAQQQQSTVNQGSGSAVITFSGAPLTPTASGTYLVTLECIQAISLTATISFELLVDNVSQPNGPGGATFIQVAAAAGLMTSFDWTILLAVALNVAHTWAVRLTCNGGATLNNGGSTRLVLIELG